MTVTWYDKAGYSFSIQWELCLKLKQSENVIFALGNPLAEYNRLNGAENWGRMQ